MLVNIKINRLLEGDRKLKIHSQGRSFISKSNAQNN